MPEGASPSDVAYWIKLAVDRSKDLALKNVVINCHGLPGELYVGGENKRPITLSDLDVFSKLRTKDIGTIWLVGCFVATGQNGMQFCSRLAITFGCFVVGANDSQFVERRFTRGKVPVGAIDDFEGAAYWFNPSGSHEVFSIHDPLAEPELYK